MNANEHEYGRVVSWSASELRWQNVIADSEVTSHE